MNVFILGTGRCGTTTFTQACRHMRNYSAAHESRCHLRGSSRLGYPQNHIEVDNRLAWFLGLLDERFGTRAAYVHLVREPEKVVQSFLKKWGTGIIHAFSTSVVMKNDWRVDQRAHACRFYVETVNANIRSFLRDKPLQLTLDIDKPHEGFRQFWKMIAAEGNQNAALHEFSIRHNAS